MADERSSQRKSRARKTEPEAVTAPEPVEAAGAELERVVEAPPAERLGLYASAEAQLDTEKIAAWRPDKDDPARIVGEVLAVDVSVTVGGATCPIVLTVNSREVGLRRVRCWHTVLLREVIEQRPQVADVVCISYYGRAKSAAGREYVGYSVAVARDTDSGPREVDYDRLALEAGPVVDDEPHTADAGGGSTRVPPTTGGGMLGPDDDMPFGPAVM